MYIIRKPPPVGSFSRIEVAPETHDKRNCSVVALHIATGMSMLMAARALESAGRVHGRGCSAGVIERVLDMKMVPAGGTEWNPLCGNYRTHKRDAPTYAAWLRGHREGTYIVFVTGHYTAVVDGVQKDTYASAYKPRRKVKGHWRIK